MNIFEAFELVNNFNKKSGNNFLISQKGCKRYKKYYIFPIIDSDDDVAYFLDTESKTIECTNILFHPLNKNYDEYIKNVEFLKEINGQFNVIKKGEFFQELEPTKASNS